MKTRYLPGRAFPAYVFVPGENPHPKKEGGHMEGEKDPIVPALDVLNPGASEALRYSLDLYNHGYYWESHVFFEALWNAHGREGLVADFLKGMIKLGAAGVKFRIGQAESARGHKERACELFQHVRNLAGPMFMGFKLSEIIAAIEDAETLPEVYPEWE